MKQFLRETWELYYWAMFCPSTLQARMNDWAPGEGKEGTRLDTTCAGTPYFTNLWEEYSGTTPEERRAGQALLRAVAAGEPLPAMDEPTRAALRRLERYHVLQRHGDGYGFEIPLVARWVRERAV